MALKIAHPLIFHYPPDPVFSPYTLVVNRPLRYLVDKPTTPLLHLSCTSLIICFFFSWLIFFYSTNLKPFPICPLDSTSKVFTKWCGFIKMTKWFICLRHEQKNKLSDKRRKFFFYYHNIHWLKCYVEAQK